LSKLQEQAKAPETKNAEGKRVRIKGDRVDRRNLIWRKKMREDGTVRRKREERKKGAIRGDSSAK